MRITFKRQANETGLMLVGQRPRGYDLRVDGITVAHVWPVTHNRFDVIGWYWSCPANEAIGAEYQNTYAHPAATLEEAKAQAKEYIVGCLQAEVKP